MALIERFASAPKDDRKKDGLEDFRNYWEMREKKLSEQAQKAETDIFQKCVFYILGFVGRGDESRLHLSRLVERNGGRSVTMMSSAVTHVVTHNLCHAKRLQLDRWINSHKIVVVDPQYIIDCSKKQKLLSTKNYLTVKPKATTLDKFFGELN